MESSPFDYPTDPFIRRHNPPQYRTVEAFRRWLRDDFNYRCPFSLMRETWFSMREFEIDHLLPRKTHPHLLLAYDNLIYLYHSCNRSKGARTLPDPASIALGECLVVSDDGSILPLNRNGQLVIMTLKLDSPIYKEMRQKWISLYRLLVNQKREFSLFFGDPTNPANVKIETDGSSIREN